MKSSRFNFFFPYMGKSVVFNSYTQQFMVLTPFLKDMYDAAVRENNFSDLKTYQPDLHNNLENGGFLVPDHLDELQRVIDLSKKVDNNDTSFHLTINPTMNCNFKCWYCYESHIKGSKMSNETIGSVKETINHIIETHKNLTEFRISWFGGEPLLYLDNVVKPISEHLQLTCSQHNINHTINFTTNGYLIDEPSIAWFKSQKIDHFQITLDGHGKAHDKVRFVNKSKGSYEQIVTNIFKLASAGFYTIVRINYDNTNLQSATNILDDLLEMPVEDRKNIHVTFHNVWQTRDPQLELCEEIITEFRSNSFRTDSYLNMVDTLRNSCYADKRNQATINYNGELFKCTAREFKDGSGEGRLTTNALAWNEKYNERMEVKFKNAPCLKCPIMPICNGGCSQVALENKDQEYCVWEDSGVEKRDIVFSKFKTIIENKSFNLA